jgi:hypothetical protein
MSTQEEARKDQEVIEKANQLFGGPDKPTPEVVDHRIKLKFGSEKTAEAASRDLIKAFKAIDDPAHHPSVSRVGTQIAINKYKFGALDSSELQKVTEAFKKLQEPRSPPAPAPAPPQESWDGTHARVLTVNKNEQANGTHGKGYRENAGHVKAAYGGDLHLLEDKLREACHGRHAPYKSIFRKDRSIDGGALQADINGAQIFLQGENPMQLKKDGLLGDHTKEAVNAAMKHFGIKPIPSPS